MNKKLVYATYTLFLFGLSQSAYANNITYLLAAKETQLFKTQNRIADMAANVNTTAFKSEADMYSELPKRLADGKALSFSKISNTTRNISQGGATSTGRQLDVLIDGPGYFMVDTPRGVRYTRAGNFKIGPEGTLITKEGYPVVGPGGGLVEFVVEFAENDIDVTIRDTGLVTVGVEERGQIGVFIFENEQAMVKEGEGLYRTDEVPLVTEESKIVQGALEDSNVNSITVMTDLVSVSRKIESTKQLQANYHDLQLDMIRKLSK
ncbi:MAG: flagellar basal-body rod protein FlgF [Rickettsiaceae bacterium]|nr:flagellar basal-body rod protein FlgF [Rickettsiaceae bacterium]